MVTAQARVLGGDGAALLADPRFNEALEPLGDLEPGGEALQVGVAEVVAQWVEADRAVPAGAAMLAVMVPGDVARAIAVPDGLPAEQLHVTLAYLGDQLTDAQRDAAAAVAEQVAGRHKHLSGQLGGLGQFPAGDDGVPVFAPVDVPGMAALRADLIAALDEAGVPVPAEHDFTPHITLTYVDGEHTAVPDPVPATPVSFGALTFATGGQRTQFPFGAGESAPAVPQTRDRIEGRVVESLGTDGQGGRIFRIRIIRFGESRNRRRYRREVMAAASRLYEGARVYDHHRSPEEMRSSTIAGMVGTIRNVAPEADGLYGDLHLLPSATHAAEVLDAALAAAQAGLEPAAGVSHDVLGTYHNVIEGGRRIDDATAIVKVNSVDIVADPAAGGIPTRMLAGGTDAGATGDGPEGAAPTGVKEAEVPISKNDVLAALKECGDSDLAGVGLARVTPAGGGTPAAGGNAGGGAPAGVTEAAGATGAAGAPAVPQQATEAAPMAKGSFLGQMMIRHKVEAAGLPIAVVESVTSALPDQVTEASVDAHVASIKAGIAVVERAGLVHASQLGGSVKVTQEAHDKKTAALDAMFDGDYSKGYRSLKEAWADFTGYRPLAWGEDINKKILQECFGAGFDSAVRSTESLDAATWAQVLGDSITRRMMKLYAQPSLQSWRKIVSDVVPVTDFREQKRERIGGYGTLPVVNQGAPYQPLPTPGDEEAVYAVIKRGGTDDLTLEAIANDDLAAIRNIPRLLGLAAAITLYRFVWDMLRTNVVCTYDSTALFHANHNNTAAAALSEAALDGARERMRQQAAFGDTTNILSLVPKTLVVPSALERTGFQLTTSAVSVTANANATIPNLHRGMDLEVIDYFSDANDWFVVGDPMMVPTIEIGFYQGREEPELFTQADQNTGSMFTADKFTYKIRHTYSGTPLDHRGFQRGTQ